MDQLERRRQQNRESVRRYSATHREKRRDYQRRWNAQNRDRLRGYDLRRDYGITLAEYETMLAAQGGRCAICGAEAPGGRGVRFHVDHDHATGRVRGLLCHRCNTSLHQFDIAGWIERAVAYLKR